MGWTYAELMAVPCDVFDVLVEELNKEP